MLAALELFLEAPVRIIADEDAEAIAVEGHGQAVPLGELLQQGEIPMQIFRGAEVQRQDGAGRIIDRPQEEQGRAGPEPVERAAVDKDEAADGRMAGAAGAMLRRPAAALGRQAEDPPNPADVLRLTGRPSSSWSFSVAWQSLKSRYVVRTSSATRSWSATSSCPGDGWPRRRWTKPRTPSAR
jgi:hypothetical protein